MPSLKEWIREDTHKKQFFSDRTTVWIPPRAKWFLSLGNGLKWIENAEIVFG